MGNPPSLGRGISYERFLGEFVELGSPDIGDASEGTEENQESGGQQEQTVHVCLCGVSGTTQADDDRQCCEQDGDGAVAYRNGVDTELTLEYAADEGNHAQPQKDSSDDSNDAHCSSLFRS